MAGDIIMGDDDLGPSQSEHPTSQKRLCAKSVSYALELHMREDKKPLTHRARVLLEAGQFVYLLLQGLITNK